MKNLQHTLKLAMIAMILVFASCSKDDSPAEDNMQMEEPTIQEQLISGKWFMQSTSSGGSNNACGKQTYLHFIDEDTLLIESFYEDAGMNCLSNGLQSLTYVMTNDTTFILQENPSIDFIIEFISETQLILKQTDGVDQEIYSLSK